MSIGIYSLYYLDEGLIYVGQSINIEKRFKEHIKSLTNKTHSNYKLQEAFNQFGEPTHLILELCNSSELNNKEIYWQKELQSLNSMDIIPAGSIGHLNSKYSKAQILKAFRYLYLSRYKFLSYKEIGQLSGTSESCVISIKNSLTHSYLQEIYPKKYKIMQNTKNGRGLGKPFKGKFSDTGKTVISPTGQEFIVTNTSKFAREHNLIQQSLSSLLHGKQLSHKGWSLKK